MVNGLGIVLNYPLWPLLPTTSHGRTFSGQILLCDPKRDPGVAAATGQKTFDLSRIPHVAIGLLPSSFLMGNIQILDQISSLL